MVLELSGLGIPYTLKETEGPKELLFTWAVSLNVQHTRHQN